jgi:hypothetical protein
MQILYLGKDVGDIMGKTFGRISSPVRCGIPSRYKSFMMVYSNCASVKFIIIYVNAN